MSRTILLSALVLSSAALAPVLTAQQRPGRPPVSGDRPPAWAYPVSPRGGQRRGAPEDDGTLLRVPGSERSFTRTQLRNAFDVADWRPDQHPDMPEPVRRGRAPDLRGCAFCHYPNGQGRPENSSLAGLPASYIVQQMADFRDGLRRSSEPDMGPPRAMINVAKAASEEEVRAAAEYFAALRFKPWIRVVETETVPTSRIAGGVHVPAGDGMEPIGQRILEMPEDAARTELRDPASGFVAYVPPGSVARGEELVTTGTGRTIACAPCHGAELGGLGPVPGFSGRSPSYVVRQLWDFRSGARNGPWAALMQGVVERLTLEDMIAIAAYAASREP